MNKYRVIRYIEVGIVAPIIEANNPKEAIEKADQIIDKTMFDDIENLKTTLDERYQPQKRYVDKEGKEYFTNYVFDAESNTGALVDEIKDDTLILSENFIEEEAENTELIPSIKQERKEVFALILSRLILMSTLNLSFVFNEIVNSKYSEYDDALFANDIQLPIYAMELTNEFLESNRYTGDYLKVYEYLNNIFFKDGEIPEEIQ